MSKKETELLVPDEVVMNKIYLIRGQKVMIDRDLAELYGVETRVLNQAVKRNLKRFPQDFMFQLSAKEFEDWKSQIVMSNRERMGLRRPPMAFTEHGVAMLSGVLNSERAIQVNIHIIRIFTRMREMLMTHKDLLLKMEKMEKQLAKQGQSITVIFELLDELITEKTSQLPEVGFKQKGGK